MLFLKKVYQPICVESVIRIDLKGIERRETGLFLQGKRLENMK